MRFKEFLENDFNRVGDLTNSFSNKDGNFKFADIESKYFAKTKIKDIHNNGKIQKIFKKQRKK